MKNSLIICVALMIVTVATAYALDPAQPAPAEQAAQADPAQPAPGPGRSPFVPGTQAKESIFTRGLPEASGKVEVVKPEDLAKAEGEKKAEAPKPAEKITTTPGVIVYARPWIESGNALTEADYGAFTSTKYSWNSDEFNSKGVKVANNPFIVEVQGILVVKEAGLYQFAFDTTIDKAPSNLDRLKYFCMINLEGNSLNSERRDYNILTTKENRSIGAAKLGPGLYQLQIAGGFDGLPKMLKINYGILMKAPGDMSFRAPKPEELVYKK